MAAWVLAVSGMSHGNQWIDGKHGCDTAPNMQLEARILIGCSADNALGVQSNTGSMPLRLQLSDLGRKDSGETSQQVRLCPRESRSDKGVTLKLKVHRFGTLAT